MGKVAFTHAAGVNLNKKRYKCFQNSLIVLSHTDNLGLSSGFTHLKYIKIHLVLGYFTIDCFKNSQLSTSRNKIRSCKICNGIVVCSK